MENSLRITKMMRLVAMMNRLRSYSFILASYIIINDPYGEGISLKQWYIMEKTGLCQRSLQLAIQELEGKGILEREGTKGAIFRINL